MTFSIVTPSFRSSAWLKLCIPSVADQAGVDFEHIVQDSCSDDGTGDWLPKDPRVQAFIEKDKGMYDAINRGFQRAQGDLLAYLNCDEQYLPGALQAVHQFFEQRPHVEVVLAGAIVVDGAGNYICHRHALVPHPRHVWFKLPVQTCSVFIRRRVVQERKIWFDTRWRANGDHHWFMALMKSRVPMIVFDRFTSTFTDTGESLGLGPHYIREKRETLAMAPRWVRWLMPVWVGQHRMRRLSAGHFALKADSYSIYTQKSPARRVRFDVAKPTAIWRSRL